MSRARVCWVLLATAVPGLLFAPVFGVVALLAPVAAVLVACYAAVELSLRVPALRSWRPLLALVLGALALVEVSLWPTTRGGLPTLDSVRALVAGVTESWASTLQSTWPVRPEAELLLFVPLLVLFTAMVGVELSRWPAVAVLPSLGLLLLSQSFVAVSGPVATLVALGYAIVVAGLFVSRARTAVVLTVAVSVLAGVVATVVPTGPAYSVRQNQAAQVPTTQQVSPLTEVAARLMDPEKSVFRYTSDAPVDRWRLVVLDEFDGVRWTASDRYLRFGAEVEPPTEVTVRTELRSARITVPAGNQWLPSQAMPARVTGSAPLIDQDTGTLLHGDPDRAVTYQLRWWEPVGDLSHLADAAVADVEVGDLGVVPPEIERWARKAIGDARPSFRTALALARYLRETCQVERQEPLPTGSGWPQLKAFLSAKRGTSEQIAAAYVVLARSVGIPARLAVGYQAPEPAKDGGEVEVRNEHVLAWPEVPVEGVGWVPLDPLGAASASGRAPTKLAKATESAMADLPPISTELPDPPVPGDGPGTAAGGGPAFWPLVAWAGVGLAALLVLAVLAIPVVKLLRRARRRRFAGVAGVVGAWWEARDLLRAHGARITPGMTARDLAAVSDGSVVASLHRLAVQLDTALWSGAGATESTVAEAWTAVREIRGSLADRPRRARFRAVFRFR